MQLSGDTTGEAYFTHLHLQRFKVDCRDKSIDGAENQTPCEFCFTDGFFLVVGLSHFVCTPHSRIH